MAAPSFVKRNGGSKPYTGVITGYEFDSKSGEKNGKEWMNHTVILTIQKDGADKAFKKFFPAGLLWDGNDISEDKRSIEGDAKYTVDPASEWGQFLNSLFDGEGNRLPEGFLDAEEGRSYNALVGVRLTLADVVDREATIAAGKRKLGAKAASASEEALIAAGKQKDKNDPKKSYMRTKTVVQEVLALPEAKGGKKGGKATGQTAAKPTAKATAKPVAETTDTDAADEALIAVIAASKDKSIVRSALGSAYMKYAVVNDVDGDIRDEIRKVLASDEFIAGAVERGVIAAEGTGKAAVLTLA